MNHLLVNIMLNVARSLDPGTEAIEIVISLLAGHLSVVTADMHVKAHGPFSPLQRDRVPPTHDRPVYL